ncbi:hypothetical protein QJQ45_007463 [Haematococcus lacustris]|nr:hypothetical protein QJQ45_007463 [Haematococcus lacustris]
MAGCEAAHLGAVDVAAAEFGMDVSRVACCCITAGFASETLHKVSKTLHKVGETLHKVSETLHKVNETLCLVSVDLVLRDSVPFPAFTLAQAIDSARQAQHAAEILADAVGTKRHVAAVQARQLTEGLERAGNPRPPSSTQSDPPAKVLARSRGFRAGMAAGPAAGVRVIMKQRAEEAAEQSSMKPGQYCHHCYDPRHLKPLCPYKDFPALEARKLSGYPRPLADAKATGKRHSENNDSEPKKGKLASANGKLDVANNQPVICEHYVKVQLRINSFCCMCLLTVMPDLVHAYDVLLGADWLTVQGALVDYVDKTLTLRTAQANPKALVTAKQAARWLRKGGSAMVAMVSLEDLALPVDAVSHAQRQHLQDLLDEYSDVFQPITGLPPERAVGHSIPLQPDGKPPARPSYRMSKPEQDELRKQITDLLAKGLIEPSSSPYAAPVLFVQKKSGELRMCIDYRQLNKITIRDQYPLPRIDDLFDQLTGKTVFSSLDLQAGYHQIRIPTEDVPKTAFRTSMGHYQFKVLCFGLTNAPATFQRVMNEAFAEVINDCALVYLDDILVMSKDSEEQLVQTKLSKCEFMQRTLKFLGHIISAQGISVDPCKVTAISEWPVPTSLKTLQSFLGAANYVRKFVHNFSTIAAPLTNLTGPKKESFPWKAWPQAELDAFHALKQAISNVPMLKLPDHSKPFQVHCDASLEGIGAVMMQDGYPLAYYSRKLIHAEINYTTGEQELLALGKLAARKLRDATARGLAAAGQWVGREPSASSPSLDPMDAEAATPTAPCRTEVTGPGAVAPLPAQELGPSTGMGTRFGTVEARQHAASYPASQGGPRRRRFGIPSSGSGSEEWEARRAGHQQQAQHRSWQAGRQRVAQLGHGSPHVRRYGLLSPTTSLASSLGASCDRQAAQLGEEEEQLGPLPLRPTLAIYSREPPFTVVPAQVTVVPRHLRR